MYITVNTIIILFMKYYIPGMFLSLMCGLFIFNKCSTSINNAENMKGILERQWNRKKSYVTRWKHREFTYLGDRVSACGRCEAVVTARTRCGWVEFGELLYGRRFPLELNGSVYES